MKIRKGLVIFVLIFVCLFHAGALYLLHNHPITIGLQSLAHPIITWDERAFELVSQQEKNILLGQIFDHLNTQVAEVKEQLTELKPEFTPSAVMNFPEGEPFLIHDGSFTLDTDPLDFISIQEGETTFWESQTLIQHSPYVTAEDFPLMADFETMRQKYKGFEVLAGTDQFEITVEYTQKKYRPGYVFKISCTPKSDVVFKRIRQNYFFLIDRSNSVPRARFALNKEIVSKSLEHLKPQDTFNIFLFDSKICRLSEDSLPWNQENITKAREFLATQTHGGYFAATDLYSSLDKVIPENVSDQEVNTAILLSDGDTYLSQERQRQTIGGWTRHNKGNVSLYAVASGGGNNLPLLDLISSFNKGVLVYTHDYRQLQDRVTDLVLSIRNPIGKHMIATAVTADKQATITLQPANNRMPDLYQNRPFVIYGSSNRLSDFVLFLQGKYYDQRFDIKKHISLSEAQIGPPSIEHIWTQMIAQDFYERFLEDGNHNHIEAAKRLLTPLNLPTPFQNR